MVKITKTDDVGKGMEQGKFPYIAGGSILVQLLWKTVWYYLLKLMIHITYELVIPLCTSALIKRTTTMTMMMII